MSENSILKNIEDMGLNPKELSEKELLDYGVHINQIRALKQTNQYAVKIVESVKTPPSPIIASAVTPIQNTSNEAVLKLEPQKNEVLVESKESPLMWEAVLQNFIPKYFRPIMLSLLYYLKLNPEARNRYIAFDEIAPFMDSNKKIAKTYNIWERNVTRLARKNISKKLPQSLEKHLINQLGIEHSIFQGTPVMLVKNQNKIDSFQKTPIFSYYFGDLLPNQAPLIKIP